MSKRKSNTQNEIPANGIIRDFTKASCHIEEGKNETGNGILGNLQSPRNGL